MTTITSKQQATEGVRNWAMAVMQWHPDECVGASTTEIVTDACNRGAAGGIMRVYRIISGYDARAKQVASRILGHGITSLAELHYLQLAMWDLLTDAEKATDLTDIDAQ
jgi:hypothetical protein